MSLAAQVAMDPMLSALAQAGTLGVVTAILFWRDFQKDKRLDKLVEVMNENSASAVAAINHLTRAITVEVLSRPNVVERAREEAREIQDAISK